ncbi:ABC transporter permease [Streptococcus cameli]
MKRPIHLYIFMVLSTIATLFRVPTAFLATFDEDKLRKTWKGIEGMEDQLEELITISRATNAFNTNLLNKVLVIVMVVLLIGTLVFLIKKQNEAASYTYIGYLFATLISATYVYMNTGNISRLYQDVEMQQATQAAALGVYGINIALFVVYFGLTVFFLLRKPKDKPSLAQTATDI